jgi:C4-type Zn-finger protein
MKFKIISKRLKCPICDGEEFEKHSAFQRSFIFSKLLTYLICESCNHVLWFDEENKLEEVEE